jgi:hypothetical protein
MVDFLKKRKIKKALNVKLKKEKRLEKVRQISDETKTFLCSNKERNPKYHKKIIKKQE